MKIVVMIAKTMKGRNKKKTHTSETNKQTQVKCEAVKFERVSVCVCELER